jgi:putative aldouronate transport system substrate-binding protein
MKVWFKAMLFAGILFTMGQTVWAGGGQAQKGSADAVDDLSTRYSYTYAVVNEGQMHGTDFNSDAVAQHFEKKFNFDWEITMTTWDNWVSSPSLWITSGDMPDMVFTDFNYQNYKSYMEQGLLKTLPAGWKEKYPNLANVYDLSAIAPEVEKRIGDIGFIPNTVSPFPIPYIYKGHHIEHWSLFFRQDWAKALGMEIKDAYTLKEFTAMIEKFMAEGYNLPGVTRGKTDTLIVNSGNIVNAFLTYQWPDFSRYYKNASGKYVWGADDPRILPMLQTMKNAIDKGIVSKNYASFQNNEEDRLFSTGQAFAMMTHGWEDYVNMYFTWFKDATGLDPNQCIKQAVLLDSDGHSVEYSTLNYWSALYFNPKMSDAKLNRLLAILDYVASLEGQDYLRYGIPGKDWHREGDKVIITREKDKDGNFVDIYALYPITGLLNHTLMHPSAIPNPTLNPDVQASVNTMYYTKRKLGVDAGTFKYVDFDLLFFDGPIYLHTSIDVGNDLLRLATMEGDLRTNYNNWLKESHAVVDPVLAELNAAFGK